MKTKQLKVLIGVGVVLGAVYWGVLSSDKSNRGAEKRDLLGNFSSAKVSKLVLEQGQEKIELELKDGEWNVVSRSGYPADSSKVGALLLKLLDLSSPQRIPSSADTFKKLGLTDESVAEGSSRVKFLDSAGQELASLVLGKKREDKPEPNSGGKAKVPSMSGQYVRRGGEEQAYLINLPVNLTLGESNWLESVVANVREASVRSVKQTKTDASGVQEMFVLEREGPTGQKPGRLSLTVPPAADEEPQESVLSQVRSALENARLSDVMQASSEPAKALVFDMATVFELDNGQVYTVSTAQQGEKVFAKFSVKLDPELTAKLKAEYDEKLKKFEADQAAKEAEAKAQQSSAAAGSAASSSDGGTAAAPAEAKPEKLPDPVKPELTLAKEDEVAQLNKRYETWVYELPSYQGKKYRYARADLIKKKEANNAAAPAGGSPHGAGSPHSGGMIPPSGGPSDMPPLPDDLSSLPTPPPGGIPADSDQVYVEKDEEEPEDAPLVPPVPSNAASSSAAPDKK